MSRQQRYRVTAEFELEDRNDYLAVHSALRRFFAEELEKYAIKRLNPDFLSIEKAERDRQ